MNRKSVSRLICLTLSSLALSLTSGLSWPQVYPNKPIKLILSYPPGGGTDFLARLVAEKLHARWSEQVVVENRPGANGIIGARAAATAKPDGYTLYVGSFNHVIMGPSMFTNYPYDPIQHFLPVVPVANQPLVLVVPASVAARSVKELIELARSQPGKLNFASTGTGTGGHFGGELFQINTGTKLAHIPYKGSGEVMTALLSGDQVSMAFIAVTSTTAHLKSGKLRALTIASPIRSTALPDVPTTAEAGLPDVLIYSWNGVFSPIGTSKDIIDQLNREVRSFLAMPDVLRRLAAVGQEPMDATPEQFSVLIKADLARWAKTVKDAGIEKQPL